MYIVKFSGKLMLSEMSLRIIYSLMHKLDLSMGGRGGKFLKLKKSFKGGERETNEHRLRESKRGHLLRRKGISQRQ